MRACRVCVIVTFRPPFCYGSREPTLGESLLCWPMWGDIKTHQVFFTVGNVGVRVTMTEHGGENVFIMTSSEYEKH